jgi:outer membrane protein, heavy metal efflux system
MRVFVPQSLAGLLVGVVALCRPCVLTAAQVTPLPISREQAVETALARGARLGVARADTMVAYAELLTARALQNPTLAGSYSKAVPQYHLTADIPFDYPWIRRTRIRSAEVGRLAAQYRFQFERAAVALDADTTYTRVLAAQARVRLSRRNAEDADSLLHMAVARRDAGDASDLDVALATVSAGQQENVAAADSLTYLSVVLDLQTVIGLEAGRVIMAPTDSLTTPPIVSLLPVSDSVMPLADSAAAHDGAPPLSLAAAQAAYESALLASRLQRRSVFGSPSLTVGFETGDPTGGETGILPTVGVAFPVPLLDRNRGPIAQANAQRERARAELTLARVEAQARIARARRELAIALSKVERDRLLITSASRVAAMSLTAYREGASSLPNVLEAQRNARDVLAQYVDDLAAAWIATAALRVFTLTTATSVSR